MMSPARRILVGVLAAAALILVLQVWVHEGAEDATAAALPEPPPTSTRLPTQLRRRAALLYLVGEPSRLPETAAPVVEVLEDGGLETLRGAPMPQGPLRGPWTAAAVVLPRTSLGELTPLQRVAFLDVCAGFSGEERLEPEQIEGLGFDFGAEELRRLLYWLR